MLTFLAYATPLNEPVYEMHVSLKTMAFMNACSLCDETVSI